MREPEIKSASAGPVGDQVRSDLSVSYEPTSDTLSVDVVSKVDYLYRDAIDSAVRRVAGAFGVTEGRLSIEDAGALEWVIVARAECCLRRAGFDGPPVLPAPAPSADSPRRRERLRRSRRKSSRRTWCPQHTHHSLPGFWSATSFEHRCWCPRAVSAGRKHGPSWPHRASSRRFRV